MIQLGILLIVLGFGSLILPEFGFQFRLMEILDGVQPVGGVVLGLAGIGVIAFHFMNQKKKQAEAPKAGQWWNDPNQANAQGAGAAFVQPDGGQAPGQVSGQAPGQAPTHPGFGQPGPTTGAQPTPQFGQPAPGQPGAAAQGYGQPQPGAPQQGQPNPYGQPQPGQPAPGQPATGQPAPGQPNPYGNAPFGQPQQSPGFGQQNPQ